MLVFTYNENSDTAAEQMSQCYISCLIASINWWFQDPCQRKYSIFTNNIIILVLVCPMVQSVSIFLSENRILRDSHAISLDGGREGGEGSVDGASASGGFQEMFLKCRSGCNFQKRQCQYIPLKLILCYSATKVGLTYYDLIVYLL